MDTNVKAQGDKGQNGHTPEIKIGNNGNWFVDGIDTNVKAQGESGSDGNKGETGKSAYEIYLQYNPDYDKSEEEWLEDLVHVKLNNIQITFNTNGGSSIEPITTGFASFINVNNPEKNGYDFVGWSLNGSLIDINTYVFMADCELVAMWSPANQLVVSLDSNGGISENNSVVIEYGHEYVLPTPSKEYQTFNGWYYGNTKIETTGTWEYTHENITLTAKWNTTKIYINLEVDSEYGELLTNKVTVSIGDKFNLPVPSSLKEGYAFTGWYLGDEKITDAEGNSLDICRWSTTTNLKASYFIEISTIYQFMELGDKDLVGNYIITKDLDFKGLGVNAINSLKGTIDGNGHKISNISLSTGSDRINYVHGLIKNLLDESSVVNLIVENCNNVGLGGLIGRMSSSAQLKNIIIKDSFNNECFAVLVSKIAYLKNHSALIKNVQLINSGENARSFCIFSLEFYTNTISSSESHSYGPNIKIEEFSVNNNTKNTNNDGCGIIYYNNTSSGGWTNTYHEGKIEISNYYLNGEVKYGIQSKNSVNKSQACKIYVNNSTIISNTEIAWNGVNTLTDSINTGITQGWGAYNSLRCIDTGSEVDAYARQNISSSIVLYPDANGVYTYYSSSGTSATISDSSLITKEMFISMLGFDENIWNLDDIDVENSKYPKIR